MELIALSVETVALGTILALFCLLVGHIWGRAVGRREGLRLGRTAAPIELRQLALKSGHCPICTRPIKNDSKQRHFRCSER